MKSITSYELKRNQFIPQPIDQVFSFFSKPENLEKITPQNLHFSILTSIPIEMKTGQVIDYLIRLKGVKIYWSSIISSYDPPHSFVDEQIRGPFTNWVHSHSFKEKNGGTIIIDHVKYSIPFGLIGRIANYFFVKNDLADIFDYREKTTMEIFNNHYDLCLEI